MDSETPRRYRIAIACDGIPAERLAQAAIDIIEEFRHRPWHENVDCRASGAALILTAENDFDDQGLALMDEFSDEVSACTAADFGYRIRLVSVIEG